MSIKVGFSKDWEKAILEGFEEYMQVRRNLAMAFHLTPEDLFEQGFYAGMQFVGGKLGLDLTPLTDEEKAQIDKLFED